MRLSITSLIVPIAAILLATGCGKKSDDGATATSAPAGSGAAGATAPKPAAPAATKPPQIDCAKAIPKEVIAKYVPNAKTEWGDPFDNGDGSFITSCRFIDDAAKGRTIVRYKCGPTFSDVEKYLAAVEPQIKGEGGSAFKFTRIEGIGRAAFRDKSSIATLHRDMPCLVEVDEMGDRAVPDWTAFLKDLEAALTPAAAT